MYKVPTTVIYIGQSTSIVVVQCCVLLPPLREKEREIAILGSVIQGMEFMGKELKV